MLTLCMTAFRRGEIKKMVTIVNPVDDDPVDEVAVGEAEAAEAESKDEDSESYEPTGEMEVAIGEAGDSQGEGSTQLDSTSEMITQEVKEEAAIANEDDAFFERLRIIAELKEAKDDLSAAQDRMANLVAERKEAKEDLQFCQERVNRLIEKLLDVDNPPVPKIDNRKPVDPDEKPLAIVEKPEPEAVETDSVDDSWRKIPTTEVLKDVKGLGKKKMEALVELYPTLGDLEDLRDQASRGFFQFNQKLPEGFGPTVADKIQEAIGDTMMRWMKESQTVEANPPPGSQPEEGQPEPESEADDDDGGFDDL